jgi:hypothetical protein
MRSLGRRLGVTVTMMAAVLAMVTTAVASPAEASQGNKINYVPGTRPPVCKNIGNGDLCIFITPRNAQGFVRVFYTKHKGPVVTADLVWRNLPRGPVWGSKPVPMVVRPQPYSQDWPTHIAPGCNMGGIRVHYPKKVDIIWGPQFCT